MNLIFVFIGHKTGKPGAIFDGLIRLPLCAHNGGSIGQYWVRC